MENATRALLIGAGVLIGVIILSLGVYLVQIMGGYAANTQNQIDKSEIAKFNQEFLKYNGEVVTIQEIITIKNYALENNNQYGRYNYQTDRAGEKSDYIDVYIGTNIIFEKTDEELLKDELEEEFTCEVQINSVTGKVFKVYFRRK